MHAINKSKRIMDTLREMMIEPIARLLRGRQVAVLTGAGCSTESGIPDYRGPSSAARARKPIQYQEFIRSEAARRRYWARSAAGWPRIAGAQPNTGHIALAGLEACGAVHGIITQNVDGLHHAAGSKRVVELHGSLAMIRCLACGAQTSRTEFQERLLALNVKWAGALAAGEAVAAPDGDADLEAAALQGFTVPACDCGGVLKPDVVFFGENVPSGIVHKAWEVFDACEVLLVIGSSLTVYSGRRFIYRAQQEGKPIAVINVGPTRADEAAAVKLEAPIGVVLPRLADALSGLV
jgi:NAD+-dependent protein deacetylase sirtuin 4